VVDAEALKEGTFVLRKQGQAVGISRKSCTAATGIITIEGSLYADACEEQGHSVLICDTREQGSEKFLCEARISFKLPPE